MFLPNLEAFMATFAIGPNTRPEDAMYWHVTGKHPHPEVDNTEPNCMNQIVQWVRDESVQLYKKVGMAALGILATLALGFVLGKKLLVCAVVTLITLVWAKRETNVINQKEAKMVEEAEAAARTLAEQTASFGRIKEHFGGAEAYEALPNLDLGGRMGHTGYIDFLVPGDLDRPIMKGNDKFGRPFVAMKVNPRDNLQFATVFVAFQRYTEGGRWDYKGANGQWQDALDQTRTNEIREIVQNNHPNFALVAAP
jgi:hypothetical protein